MHHTPIAVAVTSDSAARARMERAAAAAQVELEVQPDLPSAGAWMRAATVLLDAAAAQAAADAGLPKHDRVVVLSDAVMTAARWQACIRLGAARVVAVDESDYELVQLLSDATDGADSRSPGQVIAVMGACGGVGSSVFAAALALVAADASRHVVLCDADPGGPGLDVTLGMEGVGGARWSDISASRGRIPEGVLRKALPAIPGSGDSAVLLGFGRSSAGSTSSVDTAVAAAVLSAVQRSGETAVVDLPRHRAPEVDAIVTRADLTVLLVPAEVRGCYAAARLAPRLADLGGRLGVVVRGPSPGGIGAADVASALEVPLIAAMRPQPGLAKSIDGGLGLGPRMRGPLRRAALSTLEFLGNFLEKQK